jgi:hypothetical protein
MLADRMAASSDQEFATTVVTFEEHMRGWLAGIRRARDIRGEVRPYDQRINLFHTRNLAFDNRHTRLGRK